MALPRKRRWLVGGVVFAVAAIVCALWPPFTVVSLEDTREAERLEAFDPEAYARALWDTELPPRCEAAPEVVEVLDALAADSDAAAARYGEAWGLGGGTYFLVRGGGRVARVEKNTSKIALADGKTVHLLTGRLFGNTIRNACGLIDPSKFANSQDLNKLSAALNQIVEAEVLAELRESIAGADAITFCGAAQVPDVKAPGALEIIPIQFSIVSNEPESSP